MVAGNKLCSPKNISFFVAKVQLLSESLHKFDYNWIIFLCKVFEIWRNYFGSESYFIRNFDLSVFFFMNTFWATMKYVSEIYWASIRAYIYGLANAYPKQQQQQHIRASRD